MTTILDEMTKAAMIVVYQRLGIDVMLVERDFKLYRPALIAALKVMEEKIIDRKTRAAMTGTDQEMIDRGWRKGCNSGVWLKNIPDL